MVDPGRSLLQGVVDIVRIRHGKLKWPKADA